MHLRTRTSWMPLTLPFARVAMVGLGALATAGILALLGQPAGVEAVSTFSVLYLFPVNVACLLLVSRLTRGEGGIRALIGFDRARLGRDIAWGLLWLTVLWIPFIAALMGTMFALYGTEFLSGFEAALAPDPANLPAMSPAVAVVFGIVAVLTFAPLNAPAEELVYRAYPFTGTKNQSLAVFLPSIAFGIQHAFFAPTAPGMVVYAAAFFVWGLGSALIFRWQRRLMPLIVAHLVVNVASSVPALILPFVL